jgi:phosphoglycolate phosphatase
VNVLFDLDGTLTDPGDGFVACISYALERLGCPPCSPAEIRRHVGPPLQETLARLIEDRAMIPEATAFYRERYATLGYLENAVYAGIEEALGELRSRGARLFVATSKPTVYAERILEHFRLRSYFRAVYGSELDGTRSNKSALLAHVVAQEVIPDGVMIGDRAEDMRGARANGLQAVGALWGYGSRGELVAARAHLLCERPEDLQETLRRVGNRPCST